jgi:hypothetical protein
MGSYRDAVSETGSRLWPVYKIIFRNNCGITVNSDERPTDNDESSGRDGRGSRFWRAASAIETFFCER